MSGGPNSYIIFPDPNLTGSRNIDSIQPVPAGEYVGPAISENDNRGSLVSTMQGKYIDPDYIVLTDEDKKFDFRIQTAGGNGGGTWAHRPNKTRTITSIQSNEVGAGESVGDLLIVNGVSTPLSQYKDIYTPPNLFPATSALAKAIAINENTETHGVTATGIGVVIIFDSPILGGTINPFELTVNGNDLGGGATIVYLANDSSGTLLGNINANTFFHGMTASLVTSGGNSILKLTGTEVNFVTGSNLNLDVQVPVQFGLGWTGAVSTLYRGGIILSSATHIDLRDSLDLSFVLGINSEIIFASQIVGGTVGASELTVNDFQLVAGSVAFTTNDGTGTLRNAINLRTPVHGITASLDGTTRLKLTAVSGNLRLFVDPSVADFLGWIGEVKSFHPGDAIEHNKHFYGYNEERYLHFANGGMVEKRGASATGAFIPSLNREIIYAADDTIGNVATINCSYRNIDDENGSWTDTTINFDNSDFATIGYTEDTFKVCSMGDGTLRMMSVSDRGDINIWSSKNGLRWRLLSADIASKYLVVFPSKTESPKLDSSGDYLRLAWIDFDGAVEYFRCIVSADGGASWSEPTMSFTPAIGVNGDNIDEDVYTMAGLKDESGTFLFHYMTAFKEIITAVATGTGAFVDAGIPQQLVVPAPIVKAHLAAVRGQDDYWLIMSYYISPSLLTNWHRTGWEFVLYRINPSNPLGPWTSNNYLSGAQGTQRWIPCYMNLINCEKYISFFSGVIDADEQVSSFVENNKTIYFRLGGWDTSPIANYTEYRPESTTTMYTESAPIPLPIIAWQVPFGAVAPVGGADVSALSPWTTSNVNVTTSYTSWRWEFTDVLGGLTPHWTNILDDLPWISVSPSDLQPNWLFDEGTVIEAEVKSDSGYDNILDSYDAAIFFDVNASDHTGGVEQILYFRVVIANDGIALIDVNAGPVPIIGSFIPHTMNQWCRIRVAITSVNIGSHIAPVIQQQAMLSIKESGGYDESVETEWFRVGPFPLVETAGLSIQTLRFGQMVNAPSLGPVQTVRIASWRSINIFKSTESGGTGRVRNSACTQFRAYDIDNDWPQHLRGRSLSGTPMQMGYGISARWGGASGFSGDYFNGLTKYQYGSENILLPSPRLQYKSETDIEKISLDIFTLVLVADPDDIMKRFDWNCIAGFNSNIGDISIRVSDDKITWTALTPISVALNLVFPPDIIQVVSPNRIIIQLDSGLGTMPEEAEWNTSEGKPYYAKILAIDFFGAPVERNFNILECIRLSESSYELVLDTSIDLNLLGSVDAVLIRSGRWVFTTEDGAKRSDRYIEISGSDPLGFTVDASLNLGSLIVGIKENLTVPLEWTLQNNEQPNITNYRTKGGLSWAYPEGPPQRKYSGRLVGDVTQEQRNTLRQLLRSHSNYELRPVVLVLDDTPPVPFRTAPYSEPNNVILGRITSGSQLDNAAWYEQTKSNGLSPDINIWNQAGDMSITFEEEV